MESIELMNLTVTLDEFVDHLAGMLDSIGTQKEDKDAFVALVTIGKVSFISGKQVESMIDAYSKTLGLNGESN